MLGDAEAQALPPGMRSHLHATVNESLQHGLAGGGWDNVAYMGPWDFALEDVRCPVYLWTVPMIR